ncbi:MAG: hypothetical protein ACTS3F_01345 [Phycisphaerales bacterium]
MPYHNQHTASPRDLRFPEGGVWALRQPPAITNPNLRSNNPEHNTIPMPGDLTTDRILTETQRDLDKLVTDIDELRALIDDVVYRFPGCDNADPSATDWPPTAA